MKIEIRQRDRRALMGLALAAVAFGLVQYAVLPVYDRLAHAAETAAEREDMLRRYRRAELRKGQYVELTRIAAQRAKDMESIVIPGANASLATAELQSLIEAAGNKVGVMLAQRSMGTPKRIDNYYAELPMSLAFEVSPGQLTAFLSELRALPRFLSIRQMSISPVRPVLEAPKGGDLTKNLRVTMTVIALSTADVVKK